MIIYSRYYLFFSLKITLNSVPHKNLLKATYAISWNHSLPQTGFIEDRVKLLTPAAWPLHLMLWFVQVLIFQVNLSANLSAVNSWPGGLESTRLLVVILHYYEATTLMRPTKLGAQ